MGRLQVFAQSCKRRFVTIFQPKQRCKCRSGVDCWEVTSKLFIGPPTERRAKSPVWNSVKTLSLAKLPENTGSVSVAMEANERVDLAPVEPIDCVVQSGRCVDKVIDG